MPVRALALSLLLVGGVACAGAGDEPAGDAFAADDPTVPTGDCPGSTGCPCSVAWPCQVGPCLETPDGDRCGRSCAGGCPTNWTCAPDSGARADLAGYCVPRWGRICDPCTDSAQCPTAAQPDAVCVDRGEIGAFCGVPCVGDADCPSDYGCQDVHDLAGKATRQCVYLLADCICTKTAMVAKRSTWCKMRTPTGVCTGARSCMIEGMPNWPPGGGLSVCYLLKPQPERCDGIDNDCDGITDEQVCR